MWHKRRALGVDAHVSLLSSKASGRRDPLALPPQHKRDEERGRQSDIGDHFVGPTNDGADHDRKQGQDDENIDPSEADYDAPSTSSPVHLASLKAHYES
jgi:hypothetical protein